MVPVENVNFYRVQFNNNQFNSVNMKTTISFIALLLLLIWWDSGFSVNRSNDEAVSQDKVSAGQTVNITCSPEVYNLAINLAKEYGKAKPAEKINVIVRQDRQFTEVQNLSILSEENLKNSNSALFWKIDVARDAVVPVINAGNPMMERISLEGLTPQKFASLLTNPETQAWETIISGGTKTPVNLYIPANDQSKTQIAAFSKIDPAMMKGANLTSSGEMIDAIKKDIFSVGFCNMSELLDPGTNDFYSKIRVVPIDKNQNGRIDSFEDIYAGKNDFIHGVWIGKYPKTLCTGIYAVAPAQPTNKSELAFLEWIISEGQQFLLSTGYSELTGIQKQIAMEAIAPPVISADIPVERTVSPGWILALITLAIAALMLLPVILLRKKRTVIVAGDFKVSPLLNEASLASPAGVFFAKTHTWAFMEKEGMVKLGIDDFIQHITGSLTRVVMKSPGEKIRKGEIALTIIREGKQLNLYAPVTGIIRENNKRLLTNSALINNSPYSEGWIYTIEPKNWLKDIQYLLMGEQYREWLKDEIVRLKDFFATSVNTNSLVYSHVVLQDGGEIADHVLADLGPDVWEEFQTEFIDTVK
jgi:glycine cleavage system H lipoate-binding protein/ABC-type phosphate transport system substrate-binding protein